VLALLAGPTLGCAKVNDSGAAELSGFCSSMVTTTLHNSHSF
jgi:hypothetical protein